MAKRSNEFQKLVHYIYSKIAAPFKVSESAMVRENGTGAEREIDILIEGAIAGIEVRIAVECRDRSRTDTIEWIDHLIGKYARLKMNKIVAVSSQGFSKDAERKAAEHGISLLATEDAENVDWAKEIARPFFDVMTHSHTLLIIGGYDQHNKEILHIDIDHESYKPTHRDALSEAAYPALHRYFHEHVSKHADSQFNGKVMSENTWEKMFEDRRSKYWELTANNLGLELRSEEGHDRAIEDLDQAIRLDPNNALAFSTRGYAYLGKGQYDRAIEDLDQAILLNPNNAEVLRNRGIAYANKGQPDRAIEDYDQAIRLDPNNALAFNNRGYAYLGKGQYDRAIQDLDQAIRLNPNYALAFNNRGNAYGAKGLYDQAIADFTKAIELKPDDAIAYNNRAWNYHLAGQDSRGLLDADRAVALAPKHAGVIETRAEIHEKLGEREKAIADYRQALSLDPGMKDAQRLVIEDGLKRLGAN
jgi:tetratricopeptide (TPR) repeat protein